MEKLAKAMGISVSTILSTAEGNEKAEQEMIELCFRNGEKHMKQKVIGILMDQKTKPNGFCHDHIVQLIKQVESL